MTRLDVVAEHRDYCPWINSVSQSKGFATNQTTSRSPTFDFAGWEILLRVLQNSASSRDKIQRPVSVTDTDVEPNRISNEVSDEATEVGSMISEVTSVTQKADPAARDAKDKERWAKLKKLKQAFHVKRGRGKGPAKEKEVVKGKENVEALRGTK